MAVKLLIVDSGPVILDKGRGESVMIQCFILSVELHPKNSCYSNSKLQVHFFLNRDLMEKEDYKKLGYQDNITKRNKTDK